MNRLDGYPHEFSKLIKGQRLPVVILGAGMSYGFVPSPSELYEGKHSEIEQKYNLTNINLPDDVSEGQELYYWSDIFLEQLGDTNQVPKKLILARELRLTTDPRWLAKAGMPLRRTVPRHRVIARFTKERRIKSVWSLNWDILFESALEQVGLSNTGGSLNQPWPTKYKTIVTEDHKKGREEDVVYVYKPHGCVRSLLECERLIEEEKYTQAEEVARRFLIGKVELTDPDENDLINKMMFEALRDRLREYSLIVVGWRASENYIDKIFIDEIKAYVVKQEIEELSIVDPIFNEEGHKRLAECYELSKEKVHFEVKPKGSLSTDELFLYIQSRYAIEKITDYSEDPDVLLALHECHAQLAKEKTNKLLIDWADILMPSWSRLCWRGGLVNCEGFNEHLLRLEKEDEQVPFNLENIARPDLVSAGFLLKELWRSKQNWNLDIFPGALWEEESQALLIPCPAWADIYDLNGIKPLMAIIGRKDGWINSLSIIPFSDVSAGSYKESQLGYNLKNLFARFSRSNRFADSKNINIVDISVIST